MIENISRGTVYFLEGAYVTQAPHCDQSDN